MSTVRVYAIRLCLDFDTHTERMQQLTAALKFVKRYYQAVVGMASFSALVTRHRHKRLTTIVRCLAEDNTAEELRIVFCASPGNSGTRATYRMCETRRNNHGRSNNPRCTAPDGNVRNN